MMREHEPARPIEVGKHAPPSAGAGSAQLSQPRRRGLVFGASVSLIAQITGVGLTALTGVVMARLLGVESVMEKREPETAPVPSRAERAIEDRAMVGDH